MMFSTRLVRTSCVAAAAYLSLGNVCLGQSVSPAGSARRQFETRAELDSLATAAVLDAVDFGYRVVLATDALCSSSDETHDALLTLYHRRFGQQIETASSETILACWD